jgi:hypothetical protein
MLAGLAVPWTLAALLGWSHARHALERLGVANVALAHDARLRFGTVWALVVAFSYYGLTPLFFKIRTLFMAGGRFEEFSGYSPYLGMGAAMLLQSVVQLAVLVLGLWLAARLALSRSTARPGRGSSRTGGCGPPGCRRTAAPRRRVADRRGVRVDATVEQPGGVQLAFPVG